MHYILFDADPPNYPQSLFSKDNQQLASQIFAVFFDTWEIMCRYLEKVYFIRPLKTFFYFDAARVFRVYRTFHENFENFPSLYLRLI